MFFSDDPTPPGTLSYQVTRLPGYEVTEVTIVTSAQAVKNPDTLPTL